MVNSEEIVTNIAKLLIMVTNGLNSYYSNNDWIWFDNWEYCFKML